MEQKTKEIICKGLLTLTLASGVVLLARYEIKKSLKRRDTPFVKTKEFLADNPIGVAGMALGALYFSMDIVSEFYKKYHKMKTS